MSEQSQAPQQPSTSMMERAAAYADRQTMSEQAGLEIMQRWASEAQRYTMDETSSQEHAQQQAMTQRAASELHW
jgi:hypothetical protein